MFELILKPETWLNWLAPLIILALAKRIYQQGAVHLKNIIRASKAKELRKVKNLRWNSYLVNFHISKNSAYFTIFLFSCILFYIATLTTSFLANNRNAISLIIAISPVLFFEILWLRQDGFTKQLLDSAYKLNKHRQPTY